MKPLNAMVRRMHPPRYTTGEVAGMVGRSFDTIARWRRTGLVMPSDSFMFGSVRVWLYTDDDVERLKELAKVQRPGRKAQTSLSQHHRKVIAMERKGVTNARTTKDQGHQTARATGRGRQR